MQKVPKFTLRVSVALHEKISYMAQYNGRSKNKEIETAIKRQIRDFENLHGIIEPKDNTED